MNKKHSIKRKITGIILACWMIPVLLMLGVVWVYMSGSHRNTTAEHIRDQLSFNVRLAGERLDGAVRLSRQASYDGKILEILREKQEGRMTESKARRSCTEYLQSAYGQNETVSMAVLFFPGAGEEESAAVYSERAGGSFAKLRGYWSRVHGRAAGIAGDLGTAAVFLTDNGELYLLRNLLDSHYRTRASLVLCLNKAYCFESLIQFPAFEKAGIWISDSLLVLSGDGSFSGTEKASGTEKISGEVPSASRTSFGEAGFAPDNSSSGAETADMPDSGKPTPDRKDSSSGDLPFSAAYERCGEKCYAWKNGQLAVSASLAGGGYGIRLVMFMEQELTLYPFYGYPFIMGGIALGALILLAVMLKIFNREIAAPLSAISRTAGEIEKGNLGARAEIEPDNLEFQVITDSFNHMSDTLKQQFDRIYEEEIALREARIKSLQSSINPHFLNNTLEIINWEARLAGNDKVSGMIGALSVMLDASLDRRKLPMVPLREEMGYVSAYLYIMKERLGDKLTVKDEIPEALMDHMVPRLILQPVIENAIEHGAARSGKGAIRLNGREEGQYLILDVENDGVLEESDLEKIAVLLAPDYKEELFHPENGSRKERVSSGHIGIANVNQRLKILFGDLCGLSITPCPGGTLARLTLPARAAAADLYSGLKTADQVF